MGLPDRHTILSDRIGFPWVRVAVLLSTLATSGCGLLIDGVALLWPHTAEQTDPICERGQLQIGMAFEPFWPFVFPAVFTDEGPRVTGMDVELVHEITAALSGRCGGRPITPVLQLVRFRDLFIGLNEGKLDLFVSAVAANFPAPNRAGLAYSSPYFYDGGLTMLVRRPELGDLIGARLGQRRQSLPPTGEQLTGALTGLTVAVQEERVSHYFARRHLAADNLVLCDSLLAAFESDDPTIDVILGERPVLEYMARIRKEWRVVRRDGPTPLLVSQEHYAVVMAEEQYWLRGVVNDVLFRLHDSGRLAKIWTRWLEEPYVYPRRAAKEGLPFAAEDMPQHYEQGRCRWAVAH